MSIELEKRVSALPNQAQLIQVSNQESLTKANDFLLGIKSLRKEIDEAWDPVIESAHKAHKQALDQKKKYEAPLIEAERFVKSRITIYLVEQDRLRREAEEAKKKAEEERLRFEREAILRASAAEKMADNAEADRILEEAAKKENEIITPAIIPEKPKTTGLAMKDHWTFEIIDQVAIPREYLVPDFAKITKMVQTLKGETNIPGIRVYAEKILAARI